MSQQNTCWPFHLPYTRVNKTKQSKRILSHISKNISQNKSSNTSKTAMTLETISQFQIHLKPASAAPMPCPQQSLQFHLGSPSPVPFRHGTGFFKRNFLASLCRAKSIVTSIPFIMHSSGLRLEFPKVEGVPNV